MSPEWRLWNLKIKALDSYPKCSFRVNIILDSSRIFISIFYLLSWDSFHCLHLIIIMQLISSLAAFAGFAPAQNAVIALPTADQTVAPGNDIIVQVQLPVYQFPHSSVQF